MTLAEWQDQYEGTLYAIIDAGADRTPVIDFYRYDGSDAFPLYAGTNYSSLAQEGPWMLPSPPQRFIDGHPDLHGFYVISDQPYPVARRHWQSLIEVAYEGEVMMLRFADIRILPKMLEAMSPQEINDLLGPCTTLWAQGKVWQRTPGVEFTPRKAPWFRVTPHHLASLKSESRHAYSMLRYLWQHMGKMMTLHPDPEAAIETVLSYANQANLSDDVCDGVVAGALTLQVNLPLNEIRAPLMLNEDEMAQINNWLKQHPELIGAI